MHMSEQLIFYIVGSGLFIMVIHFAIHIKSDFSIWTMFGVFALGGVFGYFLDSMITGFLFAMIFTFIFW